MAEGDEQAAPVAEGHEKVLAVCVKNIDKQTTDDDLAAHFSASESGGAGVTKVEQFTNPKHTARVDFADTAAFEHALTLDGSALHRRDIKVEAWGEHLFEGMSSIERTFAFKSQAGRPRLQLKARTKPMPEVFQETTVHTSTMQEDTYRSSTMRSRPPAPTSRADRDSDWRVPAQDAPGGAESGLWGMLGFCCKRRSPS